MSSTTLMSALTLTLTVKVRSTGRVYRLEPWRHARPEIGETVVLDWTDLSAIVFSLSLQKGRDQRVIVRVNDAD